MTVNVSTRFRKMERKHRLNCQEVAGDARSPLSYLKLR
jgi:hypothetical protein